MMWPSRESARQGAGRSRPLFGPAWGAALCLMAAGCGGSSVGATTTPGGGSAEPGGEAAGTRVAVWPRTGDEVALSLWIDAGARDGEPPQTAVVAAFLAADRAGPPFQARVLPDGTEIHGTCPAEALSRCIRALATALGTRQPKPKALATARRRLVERRRRTRADEGRTVHGLAIRGLLGDAARGLFPLGAPADDEDVTLEGVRSYLDRHYGPSRALLAAVGGVSTDDVMAAVTEAFEPLPQARAERAERAALEPNPGTAVEVGEADWVAVATAVTHPAHGAAIAHDVLDGPLEARLTGPGSVELDATAFALRGGSLLVVRAGPVAELRSAARELALEVGRARVEASPPEASPPPREDPPSALTRAVGEGWIVAQPSGATADADTGDDGGDVTVSLGAVVSGGRADRMDRTDPDELVRRGAEARLARVLREAHAALDPSYRGPVTGDGASVVLDNGARVEVRRRPRHRRVVVSVRVRGGAAQDPPSLHGRAALLATAMAQGCGMGPDALRLKLRALDATMRPAVSREAFGVVVDAPQPAWTDAVDLVLGCVVTPRLDARALSAGRAALLGALEEHPPFGGWAARAVAPRAPGRVAPWGSAETLAHVETGDLERAWARAVVGARVGVVVEGEVPAEDAVPRVARRLARLRPGTVPPTPEAGTSRADTLQASWDGEGVAIVAAWRLPKTTGAARARELAQTIGAALRHTDAIRILWTDGDATGDLAWAAVAVQVAPDDAPGFARRVEERVAALAGAQEEGEVELREAEATYVVGRGDVH